MDYQEQYEWENQYEPYEPVPLQFGVCRSKGYYQNHEEDGLLQKQPEMGIRIEALGKDDKWYVGDYE